ncbi:MAG: metallophosphoesterase [Pseudomonadota bacterium]
MYARRGMWHSSRSNPAPPAASRVGDALRVYAIGDIHGRRDLLIELLALISEDADQFDDTRLVRLVFLGDYIDRGDDAAGVLSALRQLSEDAGAGVVFLRGNHEDALLAFLQDPKERQEWLEFGARQTLASYGIELPRRGVRSADLVAIRDALFAALGPEIGFLASMHTHARFGDVIFTHAGGNPGPGAFMEDVASMIWGHPDGLVDAPLPGHLIVHGHYDAPDPVVCAGRICVDTGAYYTGRLTALRLDAGVGFLSAGG